MGKGNCCDRHGAEETEALHAMCGGQRFQVNQRGVYAVKMQPHRTGGGRLPSGSA